MNKFKDCLTDQLSALEYDIEINGKHFARCKALSFKDKGTISAKSRITVEGETITEPVLSVFYLVLYSLISWELDYPVSEKGLELLSIKDPGTFNSLVSQISDNVARIDNLPVDNEKN